MVMQIIIKNRQKRQKLGLIEMIMQSMKKKNQKDVKTREVLRKMLFDTYEKNTL